MAEDLPDDGKQWINSLYYFVCAAFAFPNKLCSSQPTHFLTFTLPILSSIPPGESEQAAKWGLAAG